MKIRARLAVMPEPPGSYGPSMDTLSMPGPSDSGEVSVNSVTVAPYSRSGGCSTPSSSQDLPMK